VLCSWLCYEGSEEGGEEEAGACEGEEDAGLGEEMKGFFAIVCMRLVGSCAFNKVR